MNEVILRLPQLESHHQWRISASRALTMVSSPFCSHKLVGGIERASDFLTKTGDNIVYRARKIDDVASVQSCNADPSIEQHIDMPFDP